MAEVKNIYWGNQSWKINRQGLLVPHQKLTKGHKKWIDYRNPLVSTTCALREANHPEAALRQRFTDQILENLVDKHMHCISDNPVCFITCGGTASGKTSAVEFYLSQKKDTLSYLRVDYDALKRSLPEYPHMVERKIKSAAEFVHSESAKMAGKLFKKAVQKKMNIIFEKTLADSTHTKEEIEKLRKKNYVIILIATHVKKEIGLERAHNRFKSGGRFVRPEIISDTYSKVHQSLHELKGLVDAALLYDNNGSKLQFMVFVEGAQVKIIDRGLYSEYLTTVGQQYKLDSI